MLSVFDLKQLVLVSYIFFCTPGTTTHCYFVTMLCQTLSSCRGKHNVWWGCVLQEKEWISMPACFYIHTYVDICLPRVKMLTHFVPITKTLYKSFLWNNICNIFHPVTCFNHWNMFFAELIWKKKQEMTYLLCSCFCVSKLTFSYFDRIYIYYVPFLYLF